MYINFALLRYTGATMKDEAGKHQDNTTPGGRELSREEARRKRDRFLALAREQALADRERLGDDGADDGEPTVATMILPGD